MSIEIKAEIKGTDELVRNLRNVVTGGLGRLQRAIDRSIKLVEKETKPITPIVTGFLSRSLFTQRSGLTGYVINPAPYAIFVHEGTKNYPLSKPPRNKTRVRQFLKQGAERAEPDIEKIFKELGDKIEATIMK